MFRDYEIQSDLTNDVYSKNIKFKQFDNGATITIILVANGEAVDLAGCNILAKFKRIDQQEFSRDCTDIINNTFKIKLDSTVTAIAGALEVDFKITKDDKQITTFTIVLQIQASIGEGNSGDIGENTDITIDLSDYQKKTDNTLETKSKTVVGAINEINELYGDIANEDLIIKDGKLYIKQSDGTLKGTGVTLPSTSGSGSDGRGISNIEKTSTVGLVDTYTITYTDNTTSTFEVKNGADASDTLVTTDIVDSVLELTTDKYQSASVVDGIEITLPTVTDFTEIHLFFSTDADLTLILPNCGWQNGTVPTISANKTYEFIFTYTSEWLGGVIEYE